MTPIEVRNFSNTNRPVTLVSSAAVAITADDNAVFSPGCLYVGTGGDINVVLADNDNGIVFKNVPDGTFLPVLVKQVLATGTVTAADFVVLY